MKRRPIKKTLRVPRNSPCPCGSGKKYKKCCALAEKQVKKDIKSAQAVKFYSGMSEEETAAYNLMLRSSKKMLTAKEEGNDEEYKKQGDSLVADCVKFCELFGDVDDVTVSTEE